MSTLFFHKKFRLVLVAVAILAFPWTGALLATSPKLKPLTPEASGRIKRDSKQAQRLENSPVAGNAKTPGSGGRDSEESGSGPFADPPHCGDIHISVSALGADTPDWPSTHGQQTGRLTRDGIPSICTGKVCPTEYTVVDNRDYDAYQFSNGTCFDACVTATLTTPCAPPNDIFPVAYMGSFNPAALCANYLGDPGYSPNWNGAGSSVGFQFTIPAGGSVVLIVHEVTPGAGCSSNYTLDLSGVPCQGAQLAVGSALMDTDVCSLGGAGSGDGYLDPGEIATIAVIAHDIGESPATGVSATLTSSSPLITVLQGSSTFPDIVCPTGAAANNPPNYSFYLSVTANCGTFVPFTLHFTSDQGPWDYNFSLPVTPARTVTLVDEDFDSWPLTGWTVVNNGGDCNWDSALTAYGRQNGTGGAGDCADADSDMCGGGTTMNTSLVTPVIDLSSAGYSSASLSFKSWFLLYAPGDMGLVDITQDGSTWTNLLTYTADAGPLTEILDLTPHLGSATTQIRFTYIAPDWEYLWQVDDVLIQAIDTIWCADHTCACPEVTPTITGDNTICPAATVLLTTETGKSNYRWYKDYAPIGTNSPSLTASTPGSYWVYYQESNGCSGQSAVHTITAVDVPAAPTAVSATPACTGISISWTNAPTATSHNVLRGTTCGTVVTTFTGVTSPYNDTTAVAGTTYNYWVVGVNTCGASANSSCATASRLAIPSAPGAPTFASVSCTTLTVNWTAVSGATSYDVWRVAGASCAGAVKITGAPVAGTTYDDTGLAASTQYSYLITANNTCGTSDDGTCASVTTTPATPAAPGAPTLTPGCTSVGLSWMAVTDATDYEVWRNAGASCTGATQVVSTTGGATTYSDNGRSLNTQYSYYVLAKNTCGTSSAGTCATTTTLDVPAAPGAPTFTSVSCTTLTVNWTAVSGATSYDVWRVAGASCAGAVKITGAPVAGTTYDDTGLTASTQYSYLITANNACGTSADGTCASVTTTPATPAAPGAPILTPGCTTVGLSWTAVPNATDYEVWRNAGASCTGATQVVSTTGGLTTFNDTGRSLNTQYSYYVLAKNTCGTSGNGTCATTTTLNVPAAPGAPTFASLSCTTLTVNWTAVSGAASYDVWRVAGASCAGAVKITGVPVAGTTYDDFGLAASTQYSYLITANNTCGASADGTCASVTTTPATPAGPGAPTLTPGCTSVSLSWTAVPNATDYEVWRNAGASCAGATQAVASTGGLTTYNDTGRSLNTQYSYAIRAKNTCGTSGNGTCATTTTLNVPAAPADVTATPGCSGNSISWTNSPTATSHNVLRGTTCGTVITAFAGVTSPYNDTTAAPGTTYNYWVVGANSCGTGPDSSCATAVRPDPAPEAPTDVDAMPVCTGISVSWTDSPGAASYNVLRGTACGSVVTTFTGVTSPYTDSTAVVETIYTYWVVAVSSCGASGNSACASAARLTVPDAPTDVTATPGCTGNSISWTDVPTTLTDNFEGSQSGGGFDMAGWTHQAVSGSTDWAWSTSQSVSPTHSWFAENTASVSDRILVSPAFTVRADTVLSFYHTYAFEGGGGCWDGGTLEATNDGLNWTVVPDEAFASGGFNGTIDSTRGNPIGGKRAWCGGTVGPMTLVTVNLGRSYIGPNVQVRWHAGDDSSGAATGWYVDSIAITPTGTGATSYTILRGATCGTAADTFTGVTNPYNDTTAAVGVTYNYWVVGVNACGASPNSSCDTAARFEAPAAPGAPTFTSVSCATLTVNWTAVSGATSYDVWRVAGASCAGAVKITGTPVAGTTYNDTGLAASTQYSYLITANNTCGTSANGACASVTTTPATPAAPGAPTLTPGCTNVSLSWTAVPNATDYGVWRNAGASCAGANQVVASTGGLTTYNDINLGLGTQYSYYVIATNTCGSSGNGTCATTTTLDVPAAPTGVSATPGCTGNSIAWTNSPTATSHNVLRGTSCGTVVTTFTGVTSPYNDTTAVPGTLYNYWVVGVNSCGASVNSSCATATRLDAPPAPTGVSATPTCTGNAIAWTNSPPATSHNVLRGAICGTVVDTFTGVTSPYLDTTAVPGTLYNYWVVGVNSCGAGAASSCATAARLVSPTPTITGDSANTCPTATVLLSTESGMSGYQWYAGGSPIGSANSSTYTVTASGSYTVSYTAGNGCSGTSAPHPVTISTCTPNIVYSASGPFTEVSGNGDAWFDMGETWTVQVTLANAGNRDATNVTADLTGNDITVAGTGTFGVIAIGGTSNYTYQFSVSETFSPCGGLVSFNIVNKACTELAPAGADEADVFAINVGRLIAGSPTPLTIQPSVADSHIRQITPTTNYGGVDLSVRNRNAIARRAVVRFDLSGIPAGATINSATLELYASSAPGTAQTLNAHRITNSWVENTVTWNLPPVTYTASPDASINGGTSTGWKIWDVLPVVLGWTAGTYTNYGFLVKCNTETSGTTFTYTFSSRESGITGNRPILRVNYTPEDVWVCCKPPSGLTNSVAADVAPCASTGVAVNWTADAADWGDSSGTRTYDVLRDGTPLAAGTGLAYGTTTFTDTTAVVGTSYLYTVRYNNGCGLRAATAGNSAADQNDTPAAPTGISATPGCTGNSIAWTDSPGATSHDVLRGTTCGTVATTFSGVTSPYNDTAAVAGTTYNYWVVGRNGSCVSADSTCATAARLAVPAAPGAPTFTSVSCTTLTVNWTAVSGATTYDVWRVAGASCSGAVKITGTPVAGTTYNDTGLTASTQYSYLITANNTCGTSANGTCASVTTTPTTPAAPGAPTLTPGCTNVSLSWTAVPTATDYEVWRNAGASCTGATLVVSTTGGLTTYNDTGRSLGTQYSYAIRAKNTCGASGNGTCATTTTLNVPAAPGAPTFTSVSCTTLTVNWTAVSGATSYDVWRVAGATCTGAVKITGTPVAGTTYNDTGLTASTQYSYLITANNTCGTSANGTCASVTTTPTTPAAPGAPTLTPGCTNVSLSWTAVPNATDYEVWRTAGASCTGATQVVSTTGGLTTYNDTGRSLGTQYSYAIRAKNTCGASGNGTCATTTTLNVPAAPGASTFTSVSCTTLTVNWTAVSGATTYDVWRVAGGTCSGVVKITGAPVAGTTYNDTGLTASTQYSYLITANNTCGTSANGTCASVTTTPTTPAAPGAPTLTPGCTNVSLSWTAVPNATDYEVWRNAGASCTGATQAVASTGGLTTYNDTGRSLNTQYSYAIRAKNTCGASANGTCATTTTLNVPAAPTGVSATPGCTGNSIAWTNSPTATSHNVLRGTICGTVVTTFTGVTSPYNDTTAVAGTTYNYWVVGANACGASPDSSCAAAARLTTPAAPAAPTFTSLQCTTLTVNWTAVSGAASYDVWRVAGASCAGAVKITGTPVAGTTYNDTGLTQNAQYSYLITANNACGTSSNGVCASVTTATCAPNIVYLSSGTWTEIYGNGDAFYDRGEKWSVQVTLTNTGNVGATNVAANLSGTGFSVCNNPGSYGAIAVSGNSAFTYQIVIDAAFAPCGDPVSFNVTGKTCTELTPAGADESGVFSIANVGMPGPGAPTPLVIQPSSGDSYVRQDSAGSNYGGTTTMIVRSSNNANRRALVQFSLAGIPAGSTINSATLELYATGADINRTLGVHHATASWAEGTVTWTNQPAFDGSPDATTAMGTSTGWKIWDVAAVVQDWIDGTYSNYGWVVKDTVDNSGTTDTWTFATKENGTTTRRPILRVNYTPPTGGWDCSYVGPGTCGVCVPDAPTGVAATPVCTGNTVSWTSVPTALADTFEGAQSGGGFDLAGWTHQAITGATDWAWSSAQSQSPTHSWYAAEMAVVSDKVLVSPTFKVRPNTVLNFYHTYAFEGGGGCWDGGTLEVSTDGGTVWNVVPDAAFTAGGFTGTVDSGYSNPIGGSRAWCDGTLGALTQVVVNLGGTYSGQDVKIRWHEGDDSGVAGGGWFVDSITISNAGTGASSYNILRGTTCGTVVDTFAGATNPYEDTTAIAGTTYNYWVVGVNVCGASADSSCATAARLATPAAPTGVSATPGCTGNSISWTASVGATSYNVLRGTACGIVLNTFTGVTSPYEDTTAVAGTTYNYWVVALNACGASADSSCATAARLAIPAAPTGVSATPGCTGNSIAWTNSPTATSHNVLRGATCGTVITTFTGVTTPYNDTTAVAGTTYNYWVVGVNACGASADSSCASAMTLAIPAAPGAPTFTSVSCTTLTVNWTAVSGATTYDVWRVAGASCSGAVKITGAPVAGTTYDDTGLTASTQYSYLITANNTCGTSANGTCASITTTPTTPVAPGTPTLTPGCTSVGLSWTAVPNATDYEVWRNAGASCTGATQVVATTGGATTYNDTGRSLGTQYSYAIRAKNTCGTSANGTCASTTTLNIPAAPAAPTYTAISCTTLTVNWTAVSGATSYDVYRQAGASCSGASKITATPVAGTSYPDSGLAMGAQYSYFVVANNACGVSANGTCSSATTVACAPNIVYQSSGSWTEIAGNGDANYDRGEKWSVQVTLTNSGNLNATNVTAVLAGNGITVCNNPGSYGAIAISATATFTFQFVIDSGFTPCGGSVGFDVTTKTCTEQTPAGADQNDVFSIANVGAPGPGSPTTLPIQPSSADTYIRQDSGGNDNYGTATTMDVRNRGSQARRALVQFNLSGIPAGSTINSATLELYASAAPGTSQTLNVHHITGTWNETAVTWVTSPTYNGTADATISGGTTTGWKTWDVLSVVQAWQAGTYTNYGFLVKCNSETSGTTYTYTFSTRENGTNRPILRVNYTPPTGGWACTYTGSGTCTTVNPKEASPLGSPLSAVKAGVGTAVDVTYTPGCGTTDHAIYRGTSPISGSLAWTDATCARGVSGSTSFDPGDPASGSFTYFVIVGQNATKESSYGQSFDGSTYAERPEANNVAWTCNVPQDLTGTCP
jgi:hypothetical protein